MSKKRGFKFPRKVMRRRPSWCAEITILGNGTGDFSEKIYFGAFNGGEAKSKALPKIQGFLNSILCNCEGSLRGGVLLKKVPINGNGNGGVPSYVLREKYSFLKNVLLTRRASQVFKTIRISG